MKKLPRPCGHYLLVKLKKVETTQKVGSIIVEWESDKNKALQRGEQEATVIALGRHAYKDIHDGTPECKPGDLVFIRRYNGIFKNEEGSEDTYQFINDDDVIAVIEEA